MKKVLEQEAKNGLDLKTPVGQHKALAFPGDPRVEKSFQFLQFVMSAGRLKMETTAVNHILLYCI